ncbi:MAG: pyridoxal-phosphate dependent enzyme [Bacillota bacterium]
MLLSRFPRVKLGSFPTPLEPMKGYGQLAGHDQLYIKRDDLTGLAMGGNKVRNLEFEMGEAVKQKADVILVAGGLQSNYCRAAAAAAAKLGLECIVIHNDHAPKTLQGNMLLSHLLGARPVFLGPVDEEERGRSMEELARDLRARNRRPYLVRQSPLGSLGYVNAALELHQQALQQGVVLKHVAIVGAMAGTASGFLYGAALLAHEFHVHVISVEYPIHRLLRTIKELGDGIAELVGVRPPVKIEDVMTVYDDYLGPGYAIPTRESIQTIYDLARTEGIFLENVYSSKTLWGMRDLVQKGVIPRDEAACFVHTGGLPALFAQAGLFGQPAWQRSN